MQSFYSLLCWLLLHVHVLLNGFAFLVHSSEFHSTDGTNLDLDHDHPNIIFILTDEQNFRTLGCYRTLLKERQQDFIWGDGVAVDTPHIDSLAKDGILFRNYYTVSPLCTPSRVSIHSGRHPTLDTIDNDDVLNPNSLTFANVLQDYYGYKTGYIGKWHLAGGEKPGFKLSEMEQAGFQNVKYAYNRGHWKYFDEKDDIVRAYDYLAKDLFQDREEKAYATDFLFDKAVKFVKREERRGQPFALMLSIPDPHNPNTVRTPYDEAFDHLTFDVPKTALAALKREPALPKFIRNKQLRETKGVKWKWMKPNPAEKRAQNMRDDSRRQQSLRNIFGMVKCIDDNVGKLLKYLKSSGLDENTIVIFSSDHGDTMGEHLLDDKKTPYETSAGVPMIIRFPSHIQPGRVIETAYSTIDFAPTLLGIIGQVTGMFFDGTDTAFQGVDGSKEILNLGSPARKDDDVIFTYRYSKTSKSLWVAAITKRYKLILGVQDHPWFYDLEIDPDELNNYYHETKYQSIIDSMTKAVQTFLTQQKIPDQHRIKFKGDGCRDSRDVLPYQEGERKFLCSDLLRKKEKVLSCLQEKVLQNCSQSCGVCNTKE